MQLKSVKPAFVHSTMVSAIACAAFAMTSPAQAQEETQVAEVGLGTIVVTATRRDTDLQTTAVAISALDAGLIDQAAPTNLGDLAAFVPNFSASKITGFNAASFAMRGVGQNNIIVYYDAPVVVLVDDFVMPSVQTQLLDTFDVQSVEVARGPQGTLFGKNAVGGAVIVKTKEPELDVFSADMRVQYGSFNTAKIQGAINVPLGKSAALRVVGSYLNSDGYMRNGGTYGPVVAFVPSDFAGVSGQGDGRRVGGEDVFNGRVKLKLQPTDNFDALLQYERLRDNSDSVPAVNETPVGDPNFLFNNIGITQGSGDPINRAGLTNRSGFLLDMDEGHRVYVDGLYLTMNYDAGIGTFTSVSGWRDQKSRLPSTYTGAAPVAPSGEIMSLFDASRDDNRETWQQEIRFASNLDGPLQFVAGGFYQNDSTDFCVSQVLGFLDLIGVALPFGTFNQNPQVLCNQQRAKSYALFTEGTYDITEQLKLTAGARYSWDKKRWAGRNQVFVQALGGGFDPAFTWEELGSPLAAGDFGRFPDGVLRDSESWSEPTWRISLSYQATPDIFTYATYARGYKSGGYNDQTGTGGAPLVPNQIRPVDPETTDSFELGVKTQGFDDRIRFNVTGFYVTYKDLQKQIVVPITRPDGSEFQETRFFNAAKAEVYGLEAEATALATDDFTVRGVLGYQDCSYKSFNTPIPVGQPGGPGYDLATAPCDRAPKWTATLDGTYDLDLGGAGGLTLNANVNHTSRNLFTQSITTPDDNTFLDARTLVNASLTWRDASDAYFVRGIVRNLFDERYKAASQTVGGLWTFTIYGPPRFVGIEAGFKFGG